MRNYLFILAAFAATLPTVTTRPLVAQEAENRDAGIAPSDVNENDAGVQARLVKLAAEFRFSTVGESSTALKNAEDPLLSFTNPIRARGQVGAIFLWSLDNRPAVLGSLWTFRGQNDSTRLSIELHSLSQQGIQAELPKFESPRRSLPDFNPPAPAIQWSQLSDASLRPSPPALLRSKIRRHAERFSADVIDPQTGAAQALRILPKPLYEFQTDDVAFGAVFAFVLATDPELIVVFEARKAANGVELHYAFARMTGRPLNVKVDGADAWKVDRAAIWDGNQPYYFCPNATDF